MDVTIFYSWQSDLPNPINRGFIQTALEKVANAIRREGSIAVEPVIDRDTAGVPGSPDIADTILSKIDQCHVFVGDVSIVNPGSEERATPNPNVLIELGYALKRLGWERIIMVQNTAFGAPEVLPFDLRMKRVLTYHMPETGADRLPERAKLQGKLKSALELILKEIESEDQSSRTEPSNPIEMTIDYKNVKIESQRHDYLLIVTLTNQGPEPVVDYHVDLEFPVELVNEPEHGSHPPLIQDRCSSTHLFFAEQVRNSK